MMLNKKDTKFIPNQNLLTVSKLRAQSIKVLSKKNINKNVDIHKINDSLKSSNQLKQNTIQIKQKNLLKIGYVNLLASNAKQKIKKQKRRLLRIESIININKSSSRQKHSSSAKTQKNNERRLKQININLFASDRRRTHNISYQQTKDPVNLSNSSNDKNKSKKQSDLSKKRKILDISKIKHEFTKSGKKCIELNPRPIKTIKSLKELKLSPISKTRVNNVNTIQSYKFSSCQMQKQIRRTESIHKQKMDERKFRIQKIQVKTRTSKQFNENRQKSRDSNKSKLNHLIKIDIDISQFEQNSPNHL